MIIPSITKLGALIIFFLFVSRDFVRNSESPPQVIKRSFAGLNKLLITLVRELITPFKIASSVLIKKSFVGTSYFFGTLRFLVFCSIDFNCVRKPGISCPPIIDRFEFNFVIDSIVQKSATNKSFLRGFSIISKAAIQARALSTPK